MANCSRYHLTSWGWGIWSVTACDLLSHNAHVIWRVYAYFYVVAVGAHQRDNNIVTNKNALTLAAGEY
jgi:hypothetical protein